MISLSLKLYRLGILQIGEKESILLANSTSRTAGRNHYCFWINLNPKYILTNLCYNLMVVTKVRYIVSLVAFYFANLVVQIYFCS